MITNWLELAEAIKLKREYRNDVVTETASLALDDILGDEWIKTTVDYTIPLRAGSEIPLQCLRFLCSKKATLYAYEVYKSSTDWKQFSAVTLIKEMGNPIAMNWVNEFLNNPEFCRSGLEVLQMLLWKDRINYNQEVEKMLDLAIKNSNGLLQEDVDSLKKFIEDRNKKFS